MGPKSCGISNPARAAKSSDLAENRRSYGFLWNPDDPDCLRGIEPASVRFEARAVWGCNVYDCGLMLNPSAILLKVPRPRVISARHKAAVGTNLQAEFFPERLALFEPLEELVEDTNDDCINADAFGFSPFPEFVAGICADMEELRVGEFHAGLAGLHDVYLFALNMA